MKIGIDARFVGPQGTGLGKYTEKLIYNLARIDKRNQYVIFLKKDNWHHFKINQKNFKKVIADVKWYSLEEQLKLPQIFSGQKLDLLHVPHFNVPIFYKGKFVVTIHDLIHHHFREQAVSTNNPLVYNVKRIGYKFVVKNAIYKAQKIITPSNFVKKEIVYYYKIDPGKAEVTYEAAEEEYFNAAPISKNKIKNSIIYVGNVYPHKNINNLLEAVRILKGMRKSVKLIIVCPRDVFQERLLCEIKEENIEREVEVKAYMLTKELVSLFAQVTAYVFPSLSEGFGIPGLNAMASGLPVLASDIPVLKEVYANAAMYFDPNSPVELADKIEKIFKDPKLRQQLIERGKLQANKYSWLQMAKKTLEVYIHLPKNPTLR